MRVLWIATLFVAALIVVDYVWLV
jgi:hypothetical protein